MNNVAKLEDRSITVLSSYSIEEVELIKSQICPGANDLELKYFLSVCTRVNLDPLRKQVYSIERRRKNKQGAWETYRTIQTSIDGYRAIAHRTEKCAGISDAVFAYKEGTKVPDSATVTVKKIVGKTICEFQATAFYDEYLQDNHMWRGRARGMLAKCAETLALRKAFPEEYGGIYTEDEMIQADVEHENYEQVQSVVTEVKDYQEQDQILQEVKKAMSLLTEGQGAAEKGKAMYELLGVKSFSDLKKRSNDNLNALLEKVTEELKQKNVVLTTKDVEF